MLTVEDIEFEDNLNKIIEELVHITGKRCINFKPVRRETTVFSSKLGGKPYLPPDFEYPVNISNTNPVFNNIPLRFLAQINLSDIKTMDDFPSKGILQFYILDDDKLGLDIENPISQTSVRCVYHEDLIYDMTVLLDPPKMKKAEKSKFPFSGEFALDMEESFEPISTKDFRFNEIFMPIYNKVFDTSVNDFNRLTSEVITKLEDFLTPTGSKLSGYPFFTHVDPRKYDPNMKEYTSLLFQLDSFFGVGIHQDDEIVWGDDGVANFFIKPEDLKNRNFTNVLYNWDSYLKK